VRKIGTLNNPADLLTKAVDQTSLERLLWTTGVSRLDAPEIAAVTKYVKVSVVHVKQHLSAFVAASILASAEGFEDDYEWEDRQQGCTAKTVILFVLFYGAYFGIIIGAWEATKLCVKRLLVKIGLGPKKPRTRTTGINTEQAVTVIPPLIAARATTTTVAATGGHIYMTRLAGERYHTTRNCGHIMGRDIMFGLRALGRYD
jgi:hypothetical protein